MTVFVERPEERETIARTVLQALPDWFGLPESLEEYVRRSRGLPFWADIGEDGARGFVVLRETSPYAAEVFVMGVLPQFHRQGVGRSLFAALRQYARERGYAFLQVKTVQEGRYEVYDRTNAFYRSLGFRELECFPQLWDAWNPCQVYVMAVQGPVEMPRLGIGAHRGPDIPPNPMRDR